VHDLIVYAHLSRCSDIHMDPTESSLRVRVRIDGDMRQALICPKKIHSEIISRIKILSGLRTDEHQAAQDGRFRLNLEGQKSSGRAGVHCSDVLRRERGIATFSRKIGKFYPGIFRF